MNGWSMYVRDCRVDVTGCDRRCEYVFVVGGLYE